MKLEYSFSVRAPIDEVWAALLDVERAAPCLPGARVVSQPEEDVFEVEFDVAVGPAEVSYRGEVAVADRDAAERRTVISIRADGAAVAAEARVVLTLVECDDLTEGRLTVDLPLGGRTAAIDRDEIRDVSGQLIDSFARNLAALVGGGAATVNGADRASSVAASTPPVGDAVPLPPPDPAQAAEPPLRPASSSEGSWAGATRQAGATIERLRSPLAAILLALAVLAALVGRRRRRARPDAGERPSGDSPPRLDA